MRPDWPEYFLGVAQAVAARGECTRARVGAVLVNYDYSILSTGYNGAKPGAPSCLTGACPRGKLTYDEHPPGGEYKNCIAIHAEMNALTYAKRQLDTVGNFPNTVMYITRAPCDGCKQILVKHGIKKFIYPDDLGVSEYVCESY